MSVTCPRVKGATNVTPWEAQHLDAAEHVHLVTPDWQFERQAAALQHQWTADEKVLNCKTPHLNFTLRRGQHFQAEFCSQQSSAYSELKSWAR